ncbi:MAG: SWIM zinc finger family protein [Oscillospiraceae bacterium]|nr:SWIM zinc finger family protein [Oscillospiraceae bacterium]
MKIADWKKLFAPHILFRGEEYYESELVEIESIDEKFIEASVEGTDTYSVEIVLKNGRVVRMDCDCPYAADGNNCKHMAAVLFAADEAEDSYSLSECIIEQESGKREAEYSEITQAVNALSEEQLRALLKEAAIKHSDVWDQITLIGKTSVDPSVRNRWGADLREITRSASDRHGFIDYYHADDYTTELCDYLHEAIAPLMENRLVMDAFDLVGMVFSEALSQEMDDSDGGLGYLVSVCDEYWEDLIPSPEADQAKMLDWFKAEIRRFSGDVGEDFLWQVVFEYFTEPDLLTNIISLLDERIKNAHDYALERLVKQRVALMLQAGAAPAEVAAYRRQFWKYPFIRKQELNSLEAESRWQEALELLRECEKLDADDRYLLSEYSARRIRILKQSGQEEAWLGALKQHVFGFPQREMTYISELKEAVPADQWPELLQQLFQNENTKGLRRELQLSEGMLDEMMEELEKSRNPYELGKYEKVLRKVYPERVRDLMLKQLDCQMRQASERSAYAKTVQDLKRLYGYPEGRKKAAELAAAWRRDFPRRSAMLDELKKAKL